MTLDEIAQTAADALLRGETRAKEAAAEGRDPEQARAFGEGFTLVVPRLPSGRSRKIRLAGPGSPLGEIFNVREADTVASFRGSEVLRWLVRKGVKLEARVAPAAPTRDVPTSKELEAQTQEWLKGPVRPARLTLDTGMHS